MKKALKIFGVFIILNLALLVSVISGGLVYDTWFNQQWNIGVDLFAFWFCASFASVGWFLAILGIKLIWED